MSKRVANKRRNAKGSIIAEFGPAFWLLIIGFFFPTLDLMSLGLSYCSCSLLNALQCHEAALINWTDATNPAGAVQKVVVDSWKDAGIGQFVKVEGTPTTKVSYRKGHAVAGSAPEQIVAVETTVSCNPFLPVPFPFATCPGLNAPMTFVVSSERTMENPDYAKP